MESKEMLALLVSELTSPGRILSLPQRKAIVNIGKCRTHNLGGRVLVCPECGARIVQYNPCNKRGCPICYKKNQLHWQEKAKKRVLPSRHYHLTFSIPERYTRIWLRHKSEVTEALFGGVQQAVKGLGEQEGLLLGSLLVFQSYGAGMSYKPHMHCMLSGGGLDGKGEYHELGAIPLRFMEEEVERGFEEELGKRVGEEERGQRIGEERYRVYAEVHEGSGNRILEYLSKRRYGVVIDIEEGIEIKEDEVIIKEQQSDGEIRQTRLSHETFIDRYLNHIPTERQVMARYYGLYSNRHKEDYRKAKSQVRAEKEEREDRHIERCPLCHAMVKVEYAFTLDEIEKVKKMFRGLSPPEHGAIAKPA